MNPLIDNHNRTIDYLRISITDRCNLNCLYCVPFDGRTKLPMADILSYEEMFTIVQAAVAVGVTKIRITGGEPLMRKEMIHFCRLLSSLPEIIDLSLTTNGLLLAPMAKELKAAGVHRINISLDTLDARRYKAITGKDGLGKVLDGIKQAETAGLAPIKINMVPMRGINEHEVVEMARWTLTNPIDIRFIELMPTSGWAKEKHDRLFIPIDEIRQSVETLGPLTPINHIKTRGPANYARLENAQGRIGFIAALSHHFCNTCNRLRLTADGQLRACLFAEAEADLKTPLRNGASLNTLQQIIQSTAAAKPKGHALDQCTAIIQGRGMRSIGG